MQRFTRLTLAVVLSTGLAGPLMLGPSAAHAQAVLPADVAAKPDLSQADKDAIDKYIDANKAGLSGDGEQIRKSRNELLQPLSSASISLKFRLYYAGQLRPVLDPLVSDPRDIVAANALRLAGEAASTNTLPLLTTGLGDKRASVRYAAFHGMGRTFRAVARTDPAVNPADMTKALAVMGTAAAAEPDLKVLDAAMLAISAGKDISEPKVAGFVSASVTALSALGSTRAQKAMQETDPTELMNVLIRGTTAVRDVFTQQAAAGGASVTPAAYKASAEFSGDLLVAVERLMAAAPPKITSQTASTVQGAAKTVLTLAAQAVDKNAPNLPTDVKKIIGPNGWLTGAPFGFPKDRFVP